MGNTHSTSGTHVPNHNRLSKPRTNRNSPSLGSASDSSPVSVSSRYAHLSAKDRHHVKAQLFSPVERPATQPSLRGHEDVIELATHLQRRLSTASRSNSLSCFGSTRTSAVKLASLPGSKPSLISNGESVDLETAIQIVQEVRRTASPEDLAALQEALQIPSPTSSPIEPPASQQKPSRRTSLISRSTSSLLRRRSLVTTPGVATRNSPVEGSKRTWNSWKTPKLGPEEEAKWTTDKAGKSPPTALAVSDTPEHLRSPSPRAQTPGELEYSHLGSLRLGSLRVINGAASPAPSGHWGQFGTDASAFDDDYFSPVEPYDAPLTMKPTKRRGHGRSKSTVEPPTPPLYRRSLLAEDIRRAKTTSRCDSPSRGHIHARPLFDDVEPEPVRRLRVMNKSADTLADALANQESTELRADSREMEDSDEGVVVEENEFYRHEAVRLLNGTIFDEPASTEGPRNSQDGTLREANTSPNRPHTPRTDRPPPRKADSGYSSGGSLRTLQHETLAEGTTPTCSEKAMATADASQSESSSSNEGFEQMHQASSPRVTSSAPTANEDVAFSSNSLQMPHNIAAGPANHAADVRSLEIDLPRSPVSFVSHFSVDSKSSMQRRLQKSRPSLQEPPVVQSCDPVLEGTVPAVPEDVRAKFVRRLSQTPEMECLTQTYPSKEYAQTQNQTEASSVEVVSIRFPSPSPTPEPQPKPSKVAAGERERSSRSSIRRSLSLFRGKSKTRNSEGRRGRSHQEENTKPAVLDLGDIAMSLGRSPYDAAMAPTRHQSMLSPTHPHQLGNVMPRARSMVTMDAQTAAEFARKRSKDLALLRPPMPQRPRSFHAQERRHDRDEGVPSVPSLPPAHAPEAPVSYLPDYVVRAAQHRERDTISGSRIRARSTGRGPVVSEIVRKYDSNGRFIHEPQVPDVWQPHARLWNQRRKSIGEGLRQHAGVTIVAPATPPMSPQYTGPGIRQLHSYASRRGRHLSHHRGAYSSHVPAFLERA